VRIWSYINCNWDGQPMWAIKHARGVAWGDSRVEVHPSIRKVCICIYICICMYIYVAWGDSRVEIHLSIRKVCVAALHHYNSLC
jgi:hypothetical protein